MITLFIGNLGVLAAVITVVILFVLISLFIKWYKKPIHGVALVRTGAGGTKIAFETGFFVIPVLHRLEEMDITLKTITISRMGGEGLICKDNVRADIKVAFFIRVNREFADATKVALNIGCERASKIETLEGLFDAKFSEALKTVGKQFDFVNLYDSRDDFRKEILALIGRNLNGYLLDDCAIDYLEQTPLSAMKQDNILDAEGIKKIIDLTAAQQIKANFIENEKKKTITKQNAEAQETILQYERQLAEKQETQKREIANITDKERTATITVAEEQRQIAEKAKIEADEAIQIAEENKLRQIAVAAWNKERTNAVEKEKVEKDRELQVTDREKIVSLAQIEKEKEIELEKAKIQEIIRERVMVEKDVVVEQEKIKDTTAYAGADREKRVAITLAEKVAEEALVKQIKNAEANLKATGIDGEALKIAAEFKAKEKIIEAEAKYSAAGKESDAIKILAEAEAAKESAIGKAEAQVIEAKAIAHLKEGETSAKVLEINALAESKGIEAKAIAKSKEIELVTTAEANALLQTGNSEATVVENKGFAEAKVIQQKLTSEAIGIENKAAAMKKLDGIGKDHEEFKLQLQKDKDVEIAQIQIWKEIAQAQAMVIAEALKSAKIDIVGGETMFFDKIIGAITYGRSLDNFVSNSSLLTSVKDKFLTSKKGKIENTYVEKQETVEEEPVIEKPVKKTSKKESKQSEQITLDQLEAKIKQLTEKYKFLLDNVAEMRVSEVLEFLLNKIPHVDVKDMIKELIEQVGKFGIGGLLMASLDEEN
ncbi:MAG: hypothetical protein U0W24_16955 [Bacteroidales bacterium]